MLNALAQILPFCKARAVVIEAGTALAAGKGTADEGSDKVVASVTRSGTNVI
jgi:hypothetical protein